MSDMCESDRNETFDDVYRPSHYALGEVECIDAVKSSMDTRSFCGYLRGNIMKYLWRFDKKGRPVEDLRKARWYLDRLISCMEGIAENEKKEG